MESNVRTEHNNLTKRDALREAKKLRKMGFNARIIKARGKNMGWNVQRSADVIR